MMLIIYPPNPPCKQGGLLEALDLNKINDKIPLPGLQGGLLEALDLNKINDKKKPPLLAREAFGSPWFK